MSDQAKQAGEFSRTPAGTFAPGTKGGPGRPAGDKARKLAYLAATWEAVSIEEWRGIVIAAKLDALSAPDGATRNAARVWLRDTIIGKPTNFIASAADDGNAYSEFADLSDDQLRALIAAEEDADAAGGAGDPGGTEAGAGRGGEAGVKAAGQAGN